MKNFCFLHVLFIDLPEQYLLEVYKLGKYRITFEFYHYLKKDDNACPLQHT